MAVIVRNDRGKVLARISRVGRYIDLSGIKRMTPTEAYRVAVEMAAFVSDMEQPADPAAGTDRRTADSNGTEAPMHGPVSPRLPCEVCGKTFMDGRGLAGHSRTHRDVA
jgi:hypothetical protein